MKIDSPFTPLREAAVKAALPSQARREEVRKGTLRGLLSLLLVSPVIFILLFGCSWIATLGLPVASADTRSVLNADYGPWTFGLIRPVSPEIIEEIERDQILYPETFSEPVAPTIVQAAFWPTPTPIATPAAGPTNPPEPTSTASASPTLETPTPTPASSLTPTASSTATPTITSTPSSTPTQSPTPTRTPTPTQTPTRTNTPPPSNTPVPPTATPTSSPMPPTPTPTNTPVPPTPTPTNTPVPPTATPTSTPVPPTATPTNTPVPPTPTPTSTPVPPTPTPTNTPVPPTTTPTNTPVPPTSTPTSTPVPSATPTPLPTNTPTATNTPAPTPTPGGSPQVDAVSTATTTSSSVTISHTTSGTNRLMLVGASIGQATTETITSITYNGVNLTSVGFQNSPGNQMRVEIWSLVAPPTGTYNVVVNFSSAPIDGATIGVMTFTGVNQTTPLGGLKTAAGVSTSASTTVSSAVGELVFGVVGVDDGTDYNLAPDAGQTEQWDLKTNEANGGGSTEAGAASVVTSWTWGAAAADDWAVGSVSIRP